MDQLEAVSEGFYKANICYEVPGGFSHDHIFYFAEENTRTFGTSTMLMIEPASRHRWIAIIASGSVYDCRYVGVWPGINPEWIAVSAGGRGLMLKSDDPAISYEFAMGPILGAWRCDRPNIFFYWSYGLATALGEAGELWSFSVLDDCNIESVTAETAVITGYNGSIINGTTEYRVRLTDGALLSESVRKTSGC